LKSELVDKVITCTACGSANVRIKKLCPECSSLRLRKEVLIEHLSCGAIDRQTAFETPKGDLVCPRCNIKLQSVDEDYRVLPSSYVCLNCNARSSEPLLVAKCDNCLTTAQLDEEPEVYLYKYTANSDLPLKDMQQIKPIEVCTKFFRALGYKVVAPAYVNGKSETRHLFDMLVLGKVGVVGAGNQPAQKSADCKCNDNENTVIELLIANKKVDLEEITRIYGMTNDVDCEALIFVIPGMTMNARNYASAYNMKVCEGRTIEEALVNWVIPKTA
jgi:DNA-directed RNA polymerase subunit RPC12/RpoP